MGEASPILLGGGGGPDRRLKRRSMDYPQELQGFAKTWRTKYTAVQHSKRAIFCVFSTGIHFFHTVRHVYRSVWPAREAKPLVPRLCMLVKPASKETSDKPFHYLHLCFCEVALIVMVPCLQTQGLVVYLWLGRNL